MPKYLGHHPGKHVVHEKKFAEAIAPLYHKRLSKQETTSFKPTAAPAAKPPPPPAETKRQQSFRHYSPPVKPPLTLTKADFEYIREWNWHERKQRLETWKDSSNPAVKTVQSRLFSLLGLDEHPPDRAQLRRHAKQKEDEDAHAATHHEHKGRADGHILKRELEALTNAHIRERKSKLVEKDDEFEIVRNALQTFSSHRKKSKDKSRPKKSRRSSILQEKANRKLRQLDQINKQLDEVLDRAKAQELRKTYGLGWGMKSKPLVPDRSSKMDSKGLRASASHISGTRSVLTINQGDRRRIPSHPQALVPPSTTSEKPLDEEITSASQTSLAAKSSSSFGSKSTISITSADAPPSPPKAKLSRKELFKGMQWEPPHHVAGGNEATEEPEEKYTRPKERAERQEFCFGNVKLVEAGGMERLTKENKGHEFYMSLDDTAIGLGMGKTDNYKVTFFKPTDGPHVSHKPHKKTLVDIRPGHKSMLEVNGELQRPSHEERQLAKKVAVAEAEALGEKEKLRRLSSLERIIMEIPGMSTGYEIEIQPVSRLPSTDGEIKRQQFTRPARRIWYTPLPLTQKKYYRTNWKRIKYDIRKRMKLKNYWPKLWINFDESHPKQMYDLIHAKMAVNQFDQYGFERIFDWGKGIHPDYVDWILEDIVPHPGKYYYDETNEPVRRASMEDKDFKLKDWFVKPPRYIPDSPRSPPFDMHDFCGYGDRKKPFFLLFTVPRQILHYYSPATSIEKFFRQIPKPPYTFPGYTFKRWLKFPLEQKLPQYYPFPKKFGYWTRGMIGDRIQCSSSQFMLDDPLLLKRDLEYSVYHDPHARRYTLRKDVLDRMWELDIINNKGEVKCSHSKFNQNRRFLRDYEWLEECMRRWNLQWNDRQQHNRLTKDTNYDDLDWEAKNQMWSMKLERCKQSRKIKEQAEQKRYKEIEVRYGRALQHAMDKKHDIQMQMVARAKARRKQDKIRRKTVRMTHINRLTSFRRVYDHRAAIAENHRREYYLQTIADKMERQRDAFNRRLQFHIQQAEKVRQMQSQLDEEYKRNVKKHRQKIIKTWKDVPFAIVRHKLEHERLQKIAMKYFRIWLDKVRRRKGIGLPDEQHLSLWTTNTQHLQSTVDYLYKESNYVHASSFFFNFLQMNKLAQMEEAERPTTRKSPVSVGDETDDELEYVGGEGEMNLESETEAEQMDGYEADEDEYEDE